MSINGVPSPFGSACDDSESMTSGDTRTFLPYGGASKLLSPFQVGSSSPFRDVSASSTGQAAPPARRFVTLTVSGAGARTGECRSRATVPAIVIGLLGLVMVGIGCYGLLASINVFRAAAGLEPFVHGEFVTLVLVGAVALLAAFILSIRGVVVSRPRWLPATVLVLSLVLPLPIAGFALASGGEELVAHTKIQALDLANDVDVLEYLTAERVEGLYERFESFGITLPGREEVLEILAQLEDINAEHA